MIEETLSNTHDTHDYEVSTKERYSVSFLFIMPTTSNITTREIQKLFCSTPKIYLTNVDQFNCFYYWDIKERNFTFLHFRYIRIILQKQASFVEKKKLLSIFILVYLIIILKFNRLLTRYNQMLSVLKHFCRQIPLYCIVQNSVFSFNRHAHNTLNIYLLVCDHLWELVDGTKQLHTKRDFYGEQIPNIHILEA